MLKKFSFFIVILLAAKAWSQGGMPAPTPIPTPTPNQYLNLEFHNKYGDCLKAMTEASLEDKSTPPFITSNGGDISIRNSKGQLEIYSDSGMIAHNGSSGCAYIREKKVSDAIKQLMANYYMLAQNSKDNSKARRSGLKALDTCAKVSDEIRKEADSFLKALSADQSMRIRKIGEPIPGVQ